MQIENPQDHIRRIAAIGKLKVWSVVVTILGDLQQSPREKISGRVLDALVAPMGINNQALRVACHRLRRDGWIETIKVGRTSSHRLTPLGWRETQKVRSVIYGAQVPHHMPSRLVLGPPQMTAAEFAEQMPDEVVILSSRYGLVAGDLKLPKQFLVTEFDPVSLPEWVKDTLVPPDLTAQFVELKTQVERLLLCEPPRDSFESAALRLVILHQWRRMRLRHGILADRLLPPDWSGARARAVVLQALKHLPRPSIKELESL